MKISKLFFIGIFVGIILTSYSQQKIKKGISFGAIPAISFDSDLGFQYGAVVNLYHYGDGSRYPSYNHSLYMEWSRYSKGSGINRIMYDSEQLIPQVRTTADITYMTDQLMDFYGFNGYQSIYNDSLSKATHHFYRNDRKMFRIKADFQSNFGQSHVGWVAGYSFYNFAIDTVNITKLNLEPIAGGSLFQRYRQKGLINENEAGDGSIHYLKLGLKYDTRDQRACPTKGIWTEAVIQWAPKLINALPHTKLAIIHRQYFRVANDVLFAYRFDYQCTLGKDKVPYFAQPLLVTSILTGATNQGLGGKATLRGILRNRVVGDAVGFSNFEFRYKFIRFEMLKQNFYIGTNAFLDAGMVFKPIAIAKILSIEDKKLLYLNNSDTDKMHASAGIGLKIGWNENFIISADYGKAFNNQDGNSGIYIGLNYLF
ncbi:MAG: hypothetical protein AUK44_01670 [Porphyromonadaceae bacterium CG2_30_38_12]|nr:MAG: hypothetical protein AUK44_01670 [Porphyromonadaceae bacterium CG2_30_38_12]